MLNKLKELKELLIIKTNQLEQWDAEYKTEEIENEITVLNNEISQIESKVVYLELDNNHIVSEHSHDVDVITLYPFYKSNNSVELVGKIFEDGKVSEKVLTDIENKEIYIKKIKDIASKKQTDAEIIISGKSISSSKKERYRNRLEMIEIYLSDDADAESKSVVVKSLSLLALSEHKTIDDYVSNVVAVSKQWGMALNMFYSFIDSVENRMIALTMVGQFEDVDTLLQMVDRLGKSEDGSELTPPDVLELTGLQVQEILKNFTIKG